ncbi:di-heme-cytochrome C peroxidase [Massilia sp. CCM 9210]|uniref:di-heme-cytochrome C peroxidase n=1 Tax=Massilia scottii TaxID=3057166 RepID=UPI0027964FB8|nr:di-heme-cytochrome C peroxidase [Massilia sp. CCM 9210]MDQ1812001.1 di-heme-cytochrome C peroxidase [Massilia sp. CCM 9210]
MVRRSLKHWPLAIVLVLLLVIVVPPLALSLFRHQQASDADPGRGAATVAHDVFGDSFTKVTYLEQNWRPQDSLWFYTTTQGSNLLPYDFFMALEQPGSTPLAAAPPFRANEHMNSLRYLPQRATASNPDALPVGFVKDRYLNKNYVGLTCAACHTAQINYRGLGMRIDGGPGGADMVGFLTSLTTAMQAVRDDAAVRERFVKAVLARGEYASADDIVKDVGVYTQRLVSYNIINHSATNYGYARLDAFGRIYNRTLQHLLNRSQLEAVLRNIFTPEQVAEALAGIGNTLSSAQRDQVIARVARTPRDIAWLRRELFIKADAPVSYPFLWDVPQHDVVQWNGIGNNAGLGPLGRNAGEVIGVFGTLDWHEADTYSLSSLLAGQGFKQRTIRFDSSVNVENLRLIESRLASLQSPQWPRSVFGAASIDAARVLRGERLFNNHCASCHASIDRSSPERRIVAYMSKVEEVGTDPTMADNSVKYLGYSGILRNQYVGAGVGSILLDKKAPIAALLTKATTSVLETRDPDKSFVQRWAEWLRNMAKAFFGNEIKASNKQGNYTIDTTIAPYASLRAYKGRALNGIWATAPYLHNGSVPTLYDLLLPAQCPADDKQAECRPAKFQVGSREFDPVKVGMRSEGYDGFTFDTRLPGNSNAGHEYGMVAVMKGDKTVPPLTREDRLDLLDYLKAQ